MSRYAQTANQKEKEGARMRGFRRLLPRGYGLADWLMAWVGPLCLLGLLEGFSRGDVGSVLSWAASHPLLFCMNYALCAAPCLLLCLIPSRRARLLSLLALALVCALLGIVNRYKIFYRMEPLLFSDVTQLADAQQAAAGLALDINFTEIFAVAGVFAAPFIAAALWVRGRSRCGALLPLLGVLVMGGSSAAVHLRAGGRPGALRYGGPGQDRRHAVHRLRRGESPPLADARGL